MPNTSHKAFKLACEQAREQLEKDYTTEVMVLWDAVSQKRYHLIKQYLEEIGDE